MNIVCIFLFAFVLLTSVEGVCAQDKLNSHQLNLTDEHNLPAFINKWSSVRFEHGISSKDVLIWFMVVFIVVSGIILLFIFWNKSLKKQVLERTAELTVEIHERIQAQEATRISEQRFKQVIENAQEWVWEVNVEGLYTYSSPIVEKILGYTPDDIVGKKHFYDLFCPEKREAYKASAFSVFGQKQAFMLFENLNIHKNGKLVWVLTTGMPILDKHGELCGYRGTDTDVTERKLAEEKLRKSESKYRMLLENLPQKIFLKDAHSTYISCNKNYARDLGIMPQEIAGKIDYEFFPREIADKYRDDDKRILESGQVEGFEEQYMLDGKMTWVSISKTPVRNDRGTVTGILGSFLDITEQKQAENKLQKYQQRLKSLAVQLTLAEEQERRRIAANLHDNIGQSLVFSRIQLSGLRDLVSNEKSKELIDELSQTLLHIIRDTKELLFELSSPLLYEVGLSAAISQWLSEQIAGKHGLETEFIDHSSQRFQGKDMNMILFRNIRELLINVVKHAHAKKVIVSFENHQDDLIITVQDDGIGFTFEPEIKTLNTEAGFGLFSIQERMEDVGGSLKIDSEIGQGCKAILTVPFNAGSTIT